MGYPCVLPLAPVKAVILSHLLQQLPTCTLSHDKFIRTMQ